MSNMEKNIEKIKRDKRLAITKAKNQMLDNSIEMVSERLGDSPDIMENVIKQIQDAKDENINMARSELNATIDEINNAEYGQPSKLEVEKYNRWVKENNINVDELKEAAKMSSSGKVVAPIKKKKKMFSFQKDDENNDNTIYGAINPASRTVIGEGYEEYVEDKSGEEVMNELVIEKENFNTDIKNEENITENNNESLIEKINKDKKRTQETYNDFDINIIPNICEYDMIPLPSNGECYPSKHNRIAVRSMTASDENIIASPNLYEDGRVIDMILKSCILDKSIDPSKLCKGDRDAILLWLRSDAYGPEFPIKATNPSSGKSYEKIIDLRDIMEKYKEFNLSGDEDGHFSYKDSKGNIIKFRLLTYNDEEEIQRIIATKFVGAEKYEIQEALKKIAYNVGSLTGTVPIDDALNDAINYIGEWNDKLANTVNLENAVTNTITTQMIYQTVSVNGNDDKEFITNFINNMRAGDAREYRMFIFNNTPGVNLELNIDVPESDGGGSFTTFLPVENTIFLSF